MIIISDTSIISNFFIINELELIHLTFNDIIIPEKVFDELQQLYSFGYDLSVLNTLKWLNIQSPKNYSAVTSLLHIIDPGEAEAIVLAQELNADFLLIDDLKGRIYAQSLGIQIVGSVGILIKAKQQGHITLVKPYLDLLITKAKSFIAPKLYQDALKIAGE
jgi:uncharacterized protein